MASLSRVDGGFAPGRERRVKVRSYWSIARPTPATSANAVDWASCLEACLVGWRRGRRPPQAALRAGARVRLRAPTHWGVLSIPRRGSRDHNYTPLSSVFRRPPGGATGQTTHCDTPLADSSSGALSPISGNSLGCRSPWKPGNAPCPVFQASVGRSGHDGAGDALELTVDEGRPANAGCFFHLGADLLTLLDELTDLPVSWRVEELRTGSASRSYCPRRPGTCASSWTRWPRCRRAARWTGCRCVCAS